MRQEQPVASAAVSANGKPGEAHEQQGTHKRPACAPCFVVFFALFKTQPQMCRQLPKEAERAGLIVELGDARVAACISRGVSQHRPLVYARKNIQ